MDAFEEIVVLGGTLGGALVRVVFEDFFAVGEFDLGVGGFVAVFGEAEDSVVVLVLKRKEG